MENLQPLYSRTLSSNCFEGAWRNGDFDELRNVTSHFELTQQNGCSVELKDSLLLKLTILQKLFQRLEAVYCPSLVKICSEFTSRLNLLEGLIACLGSRNQHVAFSASKTIVVVLRTLPMQMIKIVWFQTLFDFSGYGTGAEQPWKKLYTIDLLRQIVKNCREDQITKPQEGKQTQEYGQSCSCFTGTDIKDVSVLSFELAEWCLRSFNLVHVLYHFVPFVVRPNGIYSFVKSCTCSASGPAEDLILLRACLKLGSTIHAQENTKCTINEHNFTAFLLFLLELVKYLQDRNKETGLSSNEKSLMNSTEDDYHTSKILSAKSTCSATGHFRDKKTEAYSMAVETKPEDPAEGRLLLDIEKAKENELCTVMALLIQYLHYQRLPPLIYKKILEVLNQVLSLPLSTFLSSNKTGRREFGEILICCSISFLSVTDCCLLGNIPKCSGFVGFGGTRIRRSQGFVSSSRPNSIDLIALRKATLLLLKSSLILMDTATVQKGTSLTQKLYLNCINLWNTGLLSLGPEILPEHKVYLQGCKESEFPLLFNTLFSDQDDELVEALLLLLLLSQKIGRVCTSEIEANVLDQFNPHWLFASFVESIDFDHSLLLDFLISSETRFLEYILHYLHFVQSDWESFKERVETYRGTNLSRREGKCKNLPRGEGSTTSEVTMSSENAMKVTLHSSEGSYEFESDDAESTSSEETELSELYTDQGISRHRCLNLNRKRAEPSSEETELPGLYADQGISNNRCLSLNRKRAEPFVNERSALESSNRERNINTNDVSRECSYSPRFCKTRLKTLEDNRTRTSALESIALAYSSSDESLMADDDESEGTTGISTLPGGNLASGKDESLGSSSLKGEPFSLEAENQTKEGNTVSVCPQSESLFGGTSENFQTSDRKEKCCVETNRCFLLQTSTDSSVPKRTEVFPNDNRRLSYETKLPLSKDDIPVFAKADLGSKASKHAPFSVTRKGNPLGTAYTETCDVHEVFKAGCFLDRTMSMLIRLRIAVERLSHAGHFPYSPLPLLKVLENVEMCYDDC